MIIVVVHYNTENGPWTGLRFLGVVNASSQDELNPLKKKIEEVLRGSGEVVFVHTDNIRMYESAADSLLMVPGLREELWGTPDEE